MSIIRKACEKDIDAVNEIYDHIHTEQEKGAVYTGWVRDVYPKRDTAKASWSFTRAMPKKKAAKDSEWIRTN